LTELIAFLGALILLSPFPKNCLRQFDIAPEVLARYLAHPKIMLSEEKLSWKKVLIGKK
jgi:hypothetical protein